MLRKSYLYYHVFVSFPICVYKHMIVITGLSPLNSNPIGGWFIKGQNKMVNILASCSKSLSEISHTSNYLNLWLYSRLSCH